MSVCNCARALKKENCLGRKKTAIEQLLEIDGAIDFFLMTASMNVNWEGSSTDIERHKLTVIAAAVNRQFEMKLDCFDVRLTWAKLRNRWETWVRATHYVPPKKVNPTTGEINIDDFAWDQLVRVVPGAEIFRRKKMISPNMVCTVFNRTPPSLAPEELPSRVRLNMSLASKMRGKSTEEEELNACMDEVYKIDKLKISENYVYFCFALFREGEFRRCFNLLPNKTLKYEYIVLQYNLNFEV
ncbi:uncharacterized protein LOC115972874 [Quercus lobata]|uniref:uncharacterized protein LOC115972874 n=1 Tax=Quercus lobata TaxID=97700 RepID=UPI001245782A|nr:uncharacterized protein LOC115972874 [Quercus lobata]